MQRKNLYIIAVDKLGSDLELVRFELPPVKSGVKMLAVDDMDALIKILHEEAKVI